jgi:hypothetical protein
MEDHDKNEKSYSYSYSDSDSGFVIGKTIKNPVVCRRSSRLASKTLVHYTENKKTKKRKLGTGRSMGRSSGVMA